MSLKGVSIVVTGAFGILGKASLHGGVDLGDGAAAQAAFDAIAKAHGGQHGLVNIAGGFRWEPVAGGSLA